MDNVMNILYVSSLCSEPMMQRLFDTAKVKPHPAPQKYHSLMVRGFVENGAKVTCLVALPVTKRSHPDQKWWKREHETVEGVNYLYMPFYNHPIPKLLGFKVYTFFYTLFWVLKKSGKKAMVCDVLNPHSFAAMWACKLLGIKSVGIVTDIPGLMNFGGKKISIWQRIMNRHEIRNIRRLSALVPLTDAMCEIINPKKRKPYVVIEGLVDSKMVHSNPSPYTDGKRHITYTGTLNAAFGVRNLIEGFMKLEQDDVVLDIYGAGQVESEMQGYMNKDCRICFHGMVPVEEAIKAQLSSFLLVNPRPTSEEFTKFSFPSKNMEYMVTGVPLMTAVLPGMPVEYHPFVFLFEDENANGIGRRLDEILNLPLDEVRAKGLAAKQFVLENKNNIQQAKKIINLIFN